MSLRLNNPSSSCRPFGAPFLSLSSTTWKRSCSMRSQMSTNDTHKKWRREFGVAELSEDSVRAAAKTGKSYLHDYLDVYKRPVMMVDASKHVPGESVEDEKLCVYLIEKALSKLPEGVNDILTIIDLRGFGTKNADLQFVTFLFDVFYYYYPKRLGQVLFVEAPFVFKPIWQLVKPMLKSYASLVRFCSVEEVRKEYFTEATIPASFKR
ncbi:uncharacterized protein LOC141692799 isoform X2 [Apium graveolens]|uniref:uncharacterized protein LOC141692799 isoform X2 n=1 Tax=Apium graveolens TaxID=4045 RepID=UPI003D791218